MFGSSFFYHDSRQGPVQARTLARCSRNPNWSTEPIIDMHAKKPPSYICCKKTDINRVTTSFRLFLTKETSPSTFLYSAAITGGSCRSLTFRLGAPLRSHLPFTLSHPSQLPGILCNDSRACTLFVTVFFFFNHSLW